MARLPASHAMPRIWKCWCAAWRAWASSSIWRRALQAPIIATFRTPPGFAFQPFYDGLAERGFLIYPGKLTQAESFRIGCIGAVDRSVFERLLLAVAEVVRKT